MVILENWILQIEYFSFYSAEIPILNGLTLKSDFVLTFRWKCDLKDVGIRGLKWKQSDSESIQPEAAVLDWPPRLQPSYGFFSAPP